MAKAQGVDKLKTKTKQKTSQGASKNTVLKARDKKRGVKKYRGQGR